MNISKQSILDKTHYGVNIYAHILRLYYPDEIVMKLVGRDCGLCRNPFNSNKSTLHIWIEKTDTSNALSAEFARHEDSANAIPAGDAFDFAELHYKQTGDELLQTLNKKMFLHIGEKRDFYAHNRRAIICPKSHIIKEQTPPTPPLGGLGVVFSFFLAPISNTKPHKAVSLLDAYNYIAAILPKNAPQNYAQCS